MDDAVARRLAAAGLVSPVLDAAAIGADATMRDELDASLDQLIGAGDVPEQPPFDPRNPS